jgi:ketosteroid isomerase-like protein
MRTTMILCLAVLVSACARSTDGQASQELASQVRAAETAFAEAMASRNVDVFASHIAVDAVFFGGKGVLRGKAAVVDGWKPFFEGEKAPFSWAPESVEVLDSGTLAFSSGPVRNAEGQQTATFNSIWRLDADGRWRVVFDKGCNCPTP